MISASPAAPKAMGRWPVSVRISSRAFRPQQKRMFCQTPVMEVRAMRISMGSRRISPDMTDTSALSFPSS